MSTGSPRQSQPRRRGGRLQRGWVIMCPDDAVDARVSAHLDCARDGIEDVEGEPAEQKVVFVESGVEDDELVVTPVPLFC